MKKNKYELSIIVTFIMFILTVFSGFVMYNLSVTKNNIMLLEKRVIAHENVMQLLEKFEFDINSLFSDVYELNRIIENDIYAYRQQVLIDKDLYYLSYSSEDFYHNSHINFPVVGNYLDLAYYYHEKAKRIQFGNNRFVYDVNGIHLFTNNYLVKLNEVIDIYKELSKTQERYFRNYSLISASFIIWDMQRNGWADREKYNELVINNSKLIVKKDDYIDYIGYNYHSLIANNEEYYRILGLQVLVNTNDGMNKLFENYVNQNNINVKNIDQLRRMYADYDFIERIINEYNKQPANANIYEDFYSSIDSLSSLGWEPLGYWDYIINIDEKTDYLYYFIHKYRYENGLWIEINGSRLMSRINNFREKYSLQNNKQYRIFKEYFDDLEKIIELKREIEFKKRELNKYFYYELEKPWN